MSIPMEGWLWLAGSLLGAVLLDGAVVRCLLELLKPPSARVFLVGRIGKGAALLAWLQFLNGFWFPRFTGAPPPAGVTLAELLLLAGVAAAAVLTALRFRRVAQE